MMSPHTTVLLVACVVIPAATAAIAQEPEPTSIQCQGKATSPVPGPWGGSGDEVSLSATINYEYTREVVLVDSRSGQLEVPFRQEISGVDSGTVPVRTGSLSVEKKKGGSKVILKMLWQKASMSADFIGFAITRGYTSVLQVDTFAYGNAPKGTRMRFSFFDGMDTILYQGTCAAQAGSQHRERV